MQIKCFFMKLNGASRTTLFLVLHLVVIFVHSLFLANGETHNACINGTPLFDVIITLIIGLLLYSGYTIKIQFSPNTFTNLIEKSELYKNTSGISARTIRAYLGLNLPEE